MSKRKTKRASGTFPVVMALVGNLFVTIIKFIGFFVSGSGALFSEAIHSLADTSNQSLLLIGIRKSSRKADDEFVYGYGRERFFWALISACGIFFIGAGVTLYKGATSFMSEQEFNIVPAIFVILIISFIIETITLYFAYRELREKNKGKVFREALRQGDPSTIAVFYEDSVAVLGIIIAFASILLTEITGSHYWDALGSIIIGLLLGLVAVLLINKNRWLLIGKAMPEELVEKVIKMLESDPAIEKVLDFKSTVMDIDNYRIKCEVEFNGSALMKEMYRDGFLKEEFEFLKEDYDDFLKFCVDYIDRVPRLMGTKIDKIEQKIQKEIPEIKHLDIEIN